VRVRRSPHLVLYWRNNQFIVRNYATASAAVVRPLVCHLLDFCSEWRTPEEIQRELPFVQPARLERVIRQLLRRSLLQRSGQTEHVGERAMRALQSWNPEAGFFHSATKNVRFWPPQEAARQARVRGRESAMPPPVKSYPDRSSVDLPPVDGRLELARVARARRTWRRFSAAAVTLAELSTILGLSLGVQKWVRIAGRDVALKTSPSGGARHPIEAYAVVRRVRGLGSGIYHYQAGRHAMERLGPAPSAARVKAYMPYSRGFAGACVVVFFTAVLERQLWRYPYSRAYRAALIEAGHVCQTFCLAATALRLAPFSLMGLADSVIEADLGLDGVTETVLYAAGVGRRPAPSEFTPLGRGRLKVRANPHLRQRQS
jgi:SagB-type dehydrogenase family enzyme